MPGPVLGAESMELTSPMPTLLPGVLSKRLAGEDPAHVLGNSEERLTPGLSRDLASPAPSRASHIPCEKHRKPLYQRVGGEGNNRPAGQDLSQGVLPQRTMGYVWKYFFVC